MRFFPAHHISRPRLADAVSAERVVIVEAGGGYGKTTLASEIVDAWGAVEIEVTLHEGAGSAACSPRGFGQVSLMPASRQPQRGWPAQVTTPTTRSKPRSRRSKRNGARSSSTTPITPSATPPR